MSTGTIHDIGYRHYDGRRLGRPYMVRSLFVHNLRAAYGIGRPARAKIMPFLLVAIMLLPALGNVAAVGLTDRPDILIRYSTYASIMQIVVAIFLATQAPVLASRELRHHVVPLYFSRPVGHVDFVVAKFAAFTTAMFALLASPVTILYIGALVTKHPQPLDQTVDFLGALVGCLLFALVLSAMGLVIAAFTPRRGLGVAGVIGVFMLTSATVNIAQGIAIENGNENVAGWAGLFTPFNLVDGVQVWMLQVETATQQAPPSGAGIVFALTCALVIAGSLAILYRRFRKAGLA